MLASVSRPLGETRRRLARGVTKANHPSVPSLKRTRSLAESRRCHAPSRHGDSQQSTRAKRKGENTPEARRRGTYEWHRHLQRDARAAVINAPRRRRRRRAARSVPQKRRPHRRRRVPVLRTATRLARERRRALLWQWPFFVPAQSAGAACTQCRCWRPPSAGLPPPNLRVAATTYSTRRRKASEPGSTYGTVRNPRRHRYTPLYIHRRRPPRRSRPPVEISDSVITRDLLQQSG